MSVSSVTLNQANYPLLYLTGLVNENTSNIDYESCASESDSGKITHDSVSTSEEDKESMNNKLYALGAKEQLIMFLTGRQERAKQQMSSWHKDFALNFTMQ